MRRLFIALVVSFSVALGSAPSARAYTLQYADSGSTVRLRWPSSNIKISLSTSLRTPAPNITEGSDVISALQRALAHWSSAADVQFVESWTDDVSASPSGAGDGVSLITIADTRSNRELFDGPDQTGRTRIFFDQTTGAINEADVVINPASRFSTDGAADTYDLETTLTHEIGHVLGLGHSPEAASAMQERQGINGFYEQASFSGRTLSEDDRAGIRALYSPASQFGVIEGRVNSDDPSNSAGVHVWAEDSKTGEVVAGDLTDANGDYRIEGLSPGKYRMVSEVSGETNHPIDVERGVSATSNLPRTERADTFSVHVFGTRGRLSTVAIPVAAGGRHTILLGGPGLDQISGSEISVTSPYLRVNPASLVLQSGTEYPYPIIGFDIEVRDDTPVGNYSIRLESKAGEVSYVTGGLTVEAAGGLVIARGFVEAFAGV